MHAISARRAAPVGEWWHWDSTGAQLPRDRHPHVRRCRVVGLVEELCLVLVQVTAAEAVGRHTVAWVTLGHARRRGERKRRDELGREGHQRGEEELW